MTNQITLSEIRLWLADADVNDGTCDLESILLNGFKGYNNEPDIDVVNYYVDANFPDCDVEDESPVEVLRVTNGAGVLLYSVVQCCQSTEIFEESTAPSVNS